ncbi:hypothetical protein D3H55_08705 [Bacillus salacetis]|uniref:Uncharacterized protein n=1 Tax=Bacillus salacetis TaxID=2315464 RepID=A0A3A1R3F3_9BACI|nr:hypothetical protein [Bacillus salacetis]RIW35116.1 hypothetical protein D3H55_08705 [Bacillus salacetis]
MNIALFYDRMSRLYFKRAMALLLLGVLLSILIPGIHIIFYLVMILMGMAFVSVHLIYAYEVRRSSRGLKRATAGSENCLVVIRNETSYCFFNFSGRMTARVIQRGGVWTLQYENEEALMQRKGSSVMVSAPFFGRTAFTGDDRLWKDRQGNRISFEKKGEGWDLSINEDKVCSLIKGKMPVVKQQLFDPASLLIMFEETDMALKQIALLFIVLVMEDYFLI